jgi:hypothetical protein
MPIEDNVPWQKRCERARRILAEGVLRSKPPWPDAKKRRDFIQKCLGYSGLHGTSFEKSFTVLAECVLQGKEEFPGRRVP